MPLHISEIHPARPGSAPPRGRGRKLLVFEREVRALEPGRALTVGRSSACDVQIEGPAVASRHATFENDGGKVLVRGLVGSSGVTVRGERRAAHVFEGDASVHLDREAVLVADELTRGVVRWHGIVAADPRAIGDLTRLARVAAAKAPVWIAGESGTGKEGAARAIHRESARCDGPFVAINCAALPEALAEAELFGAARGAYTGALKARAGAFAQAHRGTLLLDEVGELSPNVQAKLLRAIESGEVVPVGGDRPIRVDVRVVAATWRDLEREADRGRFRHDLLHRLWVLKLELLPLRERLCDIHAIVAHLLLEAGRTELMPGPELLRLLEQHSWPGNVRELKNAVERAIAFHDPLELIPCDVPGARLPRRSSARRDSEQATSIIQGALRTHRNHRGRAARALGVSRSTFYRWVRDSGVTPAEPARRRTAGGSRRVRTERDETARDTHPARVDTGILPFMMQQASVRET